MISAEERFRRRAAHGLYEEDCALWMGACDKDGYGVFGLSTSIKSVRAPRFAWILQHGPIPDGLQVLHTCDTPPCVRLEHLWLGTGLENHQDKARKGRSPIPWTVLHPELLRRGEDHHNAKLTQEAVDDIRHNYVPRRVTLEYFAKKYNVSMSNVSAILLRRSWA